MQINGYAITLTIGCKSLLTFILILIVVSCDRLKIIQQGLVNKIGYCKLDSINCLHEDPVELQKLILI